MLSYILGITWAFGYFNTLGRASQFIFVVLNSSVGIVVLAQNVLLNKKMREASIKAWRSRCVQRSLFLFFSIKIAASEISSRSSSTRSTKASVRSSEKPQVRKTFSNGANLNYDGKKFVSTKRK